MAHTRRDALTGAASVLALAACSPPVDATIQAGIQTAATRAKAIVAGFAKALSEMATIPPTTRSALQADLDAIADAADALAPAAGQAAAQTPAQQVAAYVSAFASLVPTLGLPAATAQLVTMTLTAAEALVPVILSAVGLSGARPAVTSLTVDQAMSILTGS